MHPALEPEPFRGAARHPQATGRIPLLHSRSGFATRDLYRNGNAEVLVSDQDRRRGEGGGTGTGTVAAVLRGEGRDGQAGRERAAVLCQVSVPVPERVRTVAVGDGGGYAAATGLSVPHAVVGGCGHPRQESFVHHPDIGGTTGGIGIATIGGVYTKLDITACEYPYQHFVDFGFPHQADEAAPTLLRHEDGGRHHAAHRRP